MIITDLITPFSDYAFMRKALAGCLILSLGATPLGVFMNLRRMTLMGDAMGHALLPGVALSFLLFGLSLLPMTISALGFGMLVATCAHLLVRHTALKDDAAFTLIYLLSLALGIVLVTKAQTGPDLMHILFGNVLGMDNAALTMVLCVACLSVFLFCGFYRSLVLDSFDPEYFATTSRRAKLVPLLFYCLVILNLVASFRILGTLMALGIMILPAMAARFWTRRIDTAIALGILFSALASYMGLVLSYYYETPTGPTVILILGGLTVVSALIGSDKNINNGSQ